MAKQFLRTVLVGLSLVTPQLASVVFTCVATPVQADPINYRTVYLGVDDPQLYLKLRKDSVLMRNEATPPNDLDELHRLATQELKNLQERLGELGYYDAQLDFFIDDESEPARVYVQISLGVRYTLGAFKLHGDPPDNPHLVALSEDIEDLGVKIGQPATAEDIREAGHQALRSLRKHGYPFAQMKDERLVTDRSEKKLLAAFQIKAGPLSRFGQTIIESNGGASGDFIRSRLQWKKGDIYDSEKILRSIERLSNTKVFESVKIVHDDTPDRKGLVNIFVRLESKRKNQLGLRSHYGREEGYTAGADWVRRNLFEDGETLRVGVNWGARRRSGHVALQYPDVFTESLDLLTKGEVGKVETPAYTKKGLNFSSVAYYPLTATLDVYGGLAAEVTNVTPGDGGDATAERQLTIPAGLRHDYEPEHRRFFNRLITEVDYLATFRVNKNMDPFHHIQLHQRLFIPLRHGEDVERPVWIEGWYRAGMMPGISPRSLPPSSYFYAGGAHSVRGYRFQMVGPRADDGVTPTGGRSMLTLGGELKYQFNEYITALLFVDAGTVYDSQYPDFSNPMMLGVGGGLRVRTPYGTLRMDMGSPTVKPRKDTTPAEFYLTLESLI